MMNPYSFWLNAFFIYIELETRKDPFIEGMGAKEEITQGE